MVRTRLDSLPIATRRRAAVSMSKGGGAVGVKINPKYLLAGKHYSSSGEAGRDPSPERALSLWLRFKVQARSSPVATISTLQRA